MTDARGAFLQFWHSEGGQHFRVEEEVLLPAYARHRPPDEPAVVRVSPSTLISDGGQPSLRPAGRRRSPTYRSSGERLAQHIRHEERVLFPAIEPALPDAELSELVRALERAERSA
jgi:hypothetical protein